MPKSFLATYRKTIGLCVVILCLSTINLGTVSEVVRLQNSDKIGHLLMYAALSFTAYYECLRDTIFRPECKYFSVYVFLVLTSFGGMIEVLQGAVFTPRTAELMDWIADIFGLLLGFTFGKLLLKRYE